MKVRAQEERESMVLVGDSKVRGTVTAKRKPGISTWKISAKMSGKPRIHLKADVGAGQLKQYIAVQFPSYDVYTMTEWRKMCKNNRAKAKKAAPKSAYKNLDYAISIIDRECPGPGDVCELFLGLLMERGVDHESLVEIVNQIRASVERKNAAHTS